MIVIAALFLKGETVTLNRVAGLVVGFIGVAILVGLDVDRPRLGERARRARADRGDDLVRRRRRLRQGATSTASGR